MSHFFRTACRLRVVGSAQGHPRKRPVRSACRRELEACEGRVLMATLSLGTAQSFAVLGGSAVTSTGPSAIVGDLGVAPGTAVTGFPPGLVTGGTIHSADAVALRAQTDLTTAYNVLAGEPSAADLTGKDLGGMTLTPGVYRFTSSAQLTGTLTLDAQGDPNARFDFQIGSTLTTAGAASIRLIDGADACNVFWQVGSSATLGTDSTFEGNILALTSITLNTHANILSGRALARNGAVTLDSATVSDVCTPAVTPPATQPVGTPGSTTGTAPVATTGTAPVATTGTAPVATTITLPGGTTITLPGGSQVVPPGVTPVLLPGETTVLLPDGTKVVEPALGAPPQVTSLTRYGFHARPTVLVLSFNTALTPAAAGNVANYTIFGPLTGAGSRHPRAIAINSAVYDPATNTVTLRPRTRLNVHQTYRLTVHGTGTGALTSTSGVLLDGERTGQPGSNYSATVTWANLVFTDPPGGQPVSTSWVHRPAVNAALAMARLARWVRQHPGTHHQPR